MTKEEFEELIERAKIANSINAKINELEYLLYERTYNNIEGIGIIEIFHRIRNPYLFDISAFSSSPEIESINEKVFALVRAEYETLLEQLRAEFAALK